MAMERVTWLVLVADMVALVHVAYVLFVVLGELLILAGWWRGWAWTRGWWFRMTHLAAIVFVVLEAWAGLWCPLTLWEDALRREAGQQGYDASFLGYWMGRLFYYEAPLWVFTALYTLFALLVLLSYLAYPPRRRPIGR